MNTVESGSSGSELSKTLADTIKGTHEQLRRLLGEEKDFDCIWRAHLNDSLGRRNYAQSMYKLATEYWEGGAENCRVKWCHDMLRKYYTQTVHQYIEKDLRVACCELDSIASTEGLCENNSTRTQDLNQSTAESFVSNISNLDNILVNDPTSQMYSIGSSERRNHETAPGSIDKVPKDPNQRMQIKRIRDQFKTVSDSERLEEFRRSGAELLFGEDYSEPEFIRNKRLLDVGSCYNPFSKLKDEDLEIIAIDLTPACETVYPVDFVNTPTRYDCSCFDQSESSLCEKKRSVNCLPESYFDVITFCLLLSYIPSPVQRLNFCSKARKLLKFNGLLLITETQSVTPHNNLMLMKQWKCEIENLGFRRIAYENQTHIHAMAFRKVPFWLRRCSFEGNDVPKTKANKKNVYSLKGGLSINQDFQKQAKKRRQSREVVNSGHDVNDCGGGGVGSGRDDNSGKRVGVGMEGDKCGSNNNGHGLMGGAGGGTRNGVAADLDNSGKRARLLLLEDNGREEN